VALTPLGSVAVPPFRPTTFDHGDVHLATGRIFAAHTAAGSVEVIDGQRQAHLRTIGGCPEASGVLCVQHQGVVFAAARGAGKVLVIDAESLALLREVSCGLRPNGLAWDEGRGRLLVADVQEMSARLLDPSTGEGLGQLELPGRPRWCVYDRDGDRFLVNIREPACLALLTAEPFALADRWPVSSAGPHGLDLDAQGRRAFVACDGGRVAVLDLGSGNQVAEVQIAGAPDAIWNNPEHRLLYVAIGDPGLVEVIDTATMTHRQQIVTETGAHTTAFDVARQQLAVFLPDSCRVALYRETGARRP
jgi:DNA-binding beta-propeller fold protein YncE